MRTVAVMMAPDRKNILPVARKALSLLERQGIAVRMRAPDAQRLRRPDLACPDEKIPVGADMVLSLGGDGAMLAAARLAAPHRIPILGLHVGGLGFLTVPMASRLKEALHRALSGDYQIEERMMLGAQVIRGGKRVRSLLALNDIVIRNGAFSRVLRLTTRINGRFLAVFPADGVIICTPTGSTAYSLSASGPVVDPEAQVIVVTPICPHTLSARPLVLPARRQAEIVIPAFGSAEQVMVTADGQVAFPLESEDVVAVRRAAHTARVVSFGDLDFYQKLRGRLGWGGTLPAR